MDSFYRAFEDRYRGSRDLIASRLQVYLPFIRPLVAQRSDAAALDLGCGRGEWLELVMSAGFRAQGVDLDEGMLAACRERGMEVEQRDALDKLRSLPDASIAVVSAFHVVEHISFDDVRELVAQAFRVLVPGGVLIMETPNPENLVVAGSRFYMDPTHLKPLPPPLLSFAAEHAGFERVKVLRLQEAESLHDPAAAPTLLNVLEEVSPDYSVVAQKGGDETALAGTAAAFKREYGLTLPALAMRHTEKAEARVSQLEAGVAGLDVRAERLEGGIGGADARVTQLEAALTSAVERIAHLESGLLATQAMAVDAHKEAKAIQSAVQQAIAKAFKSLGAEKIPELEHRVEHAEMLAQQYHSQLEAVHASTSWRVTAPLRGAGTVVHALQRYPVKLKVKQAIRGSAGLAQRQPWLAVPAQRVLKRFPRLKLRLARVLLGFEVHPAPPAIALPSDAVHLTPHAREIYANLKAAVARRDTEG